MLIHNNISLRPIEHDDLEFLRLMHNQYSTIMNLTNTCMVNEIQQDQWFKSICNSKSSFRFAVIYKYQIVGCIRLDCYDPRNRSVMVGGDIEEKHRSKGLGSQMFSACLKYVFSVMNCHRAYLLVLETNKHAISLYKKHGFIEEGRQVDALYRPCEDRQYLDYIGMYLLEDDYWRQTCE